MLLQTLTGSDAIFSVDVRLSAPEIVLLPAKSELYQLLIRLVAGILESTKQFRRWYEGSCEVSAGELFVDDDEEPTVFLLCQTKL